MATKYLMDIYPTLGGDPEFFVKNTETYKTISADKFFPGKENKMIVKNYGSLHFDGVQAEINFFASTCREYVQDNIFQCLRAARSVVGEGNILSSVPSVVMPYKDLREAHPEARRFGCNPDWDAYTRQMNVCEIDGETHKTRYAGGHIHIGKEPYYGSTPKHYKLDDKETHLILIKLMDIIVGIPTTMLDQSPEAKRRRKSYGHAGCFRPTPHGIEYRTPSNFWLVSPAITSFVMGLARLSYNVLMSGLEEEYFKRVTEDEVQKAINSNSLSLSTRVYEKIKELLVVHGVNMTGGFYQPSYFEFMVNYGVLKFFGGYENIPNNWMLDSTFYPHGGTARGWVETMYRKTDSNRTIKDALTEFNKKYRKDGPFEQMVF